MVYYIWIKHKMRMEIINYYYYVENGTLLCDKSRLLRSSKNWLPKFMHIYDFIQKKQRNKMEKETEEIILICKNFRSYFHHMICTNNCY